MPFFSTIIPVYNRAALVAATLDSVLAQEGADQEVICVDDGSTDGTAEVLRRYEGRVQVLRQENRGPGAARNRGIEQASGRYAVFVDGDDLWFPWTLRTYARVVRENGEPAVVAGSLFYFTEEAELAPLREEKPAWEAFLDYYASSQRGLYCGSSQMCACLDRLREVGGFTDRNVNAEDHDLMMRLGTAAGFVNVTAPALVGYRQHPNALTRDVDRTSAGVEHLLAREEAGLYPGGDDRRRDRWEILTRHVRPVTLALLRRREYRRAWALYRRTFRWHLALGRLAYLAGFPATAARRWGTA